MEKITFDELPSAVSGLYAKLESIEQLLLKQQSTPNPDELFTIHQAAEFLNLSVTTLYSKVSSMAIPVSKRAGRLYFSKSELIEYVKGGRKKTLEDLKSRTDSYIGKKSKRG